MSSSFTTTQKLLLLQSAVAHSFTTKSSLLSLLSSQHPQIDSQVIETFLDNLVDFEAVQKFKEEKEEEETEEIPQVKDEDNFTFNANDNIDTFSSAPQSPTTTPSLSLLSQSQSPSIIAPTPSQSPHLVPVRTPSGRTLRSNSTVNTSEPRRLRSNK